MERGADGTLSGADVRRCVGLYEEALAGWRGGAFVRAMRGLRRLWRATGVRSQRSLLLKAYIERDADKPLSELRTLRRLLFLYDAEQEDAVLAEAWSLLGAACSALGLSEEATDAFLMAARREPVLAKKRIEYSNAIFATNHDLSVTPEKLRALYAGYRALLADIRPLPKASSRGGHLRVGYLSGDLRAHPVAYFVYALLAHFDAARFSVYCYAVGQKDDEMTERLRRLPVAWRSLPGGDGAAAARAIRADGIDILVDLTGHTAGNCLPVLAFRPAPVQLSGIGYMGSTGLFCVDAFLSDMHCALAARSPFFTEPLLRLPRTHFCYTPPHDFPSVAPAPPCEKNGFVTFGCFNNFAKVNDDVLRLWARVLDETNGARLLVKHKIFDSREGRRFALARMAACGIDARRLILRGFSRAYLAEYGDVDIALDPFPYTGGLTTVEALLMGVPVVTLAGARHGARFGVSLLKNAGLDALVADTADDYVRLAASLARDPALLKSLRTHLRAMVAASPLMDAKAYVRDVEAAYIELWRKYEARV